MTSPTSIDLCKIHNEPRGPQGYCASCESEFTQRELERESGTFTIKPRPEGHRPAGYGFVSDVRE